MITARLRTNIQRIHQSDKWLNDPNPQVRYRLRDLERPEWFRTNWLLAMFSRWAEPALVDSFTSLQSRWLSPMATRSKSPSGQSIPTGLDSTPVARSSMKEFWQDSSTKPSEFSRSIYPTQKRTSRMSSESPSTRPSSESSIHLSSRLKEIPLRR